MNTLFGSIESLKDRLPSEANLLLQRISKIKKKSQIFWRDEPISLTAKCGLDLAHYLSFHFRKDFFKESKNTIINLLNNNNYFYFQKDVTELLLSPINQKTIDDWKINTGLPEP